MAIYAVKVYKRGRLRIISIIKVVNLKKTYKSYERGSGFAETLKSVFIRRTVETHALKGISFTVEGGELLGFLGPNGAGKSTTLKILTGVLFPTSGEAQVMGYTPWKQRRTYVANIGAVFGQKSQLIWDIPPVDSFEMNRAIYGVGKMDYYKRLGTLTELLELGNLIRKPTRQLSLGERMKCEFIMAMLHEPKVVFLDEPTIGLDLVARDRIREFISEKNRGGTTFILSTHDISDVERLAKRVIVINHGEVVYDNSLDALRNHFGSRKIINLSTASELPELERIEGVTVINRVSNYNAELELATDSMELNEFIKRVNEQAIVNDITIGNPNIENVIKMLYRRD